MTDARQARPLYTQEVEAAEWIAHLKAGDIAGYTIAEDMLATMQRQSAELASLRAQLAEAQARAMATDGALAQMALHGCSPGGVFACKPLAAAALQQPTEPCPTCHGKGVIIPDWGRDHPDAPPCPDCAEPT